MRIWYKDHAVKREWCGKCALAILIKEGERGSENTGGKDNQGKMKGPGEKKWFPRRQKGRQRGDEGGDWLH